MKKGLFDFLSKSILGKEKKSGTGSRPSTNTSAAGATEMTDDQFFEQTQNTRQSRFSNQEGRSSQHGKRTAAPQANRNSARMPAHQPDKDRQQTAMMSRPS